MVLHHIARAKNDVFHRSIDRMLASHSWLRGGKIRSLTGWEDSQLRLGTAGSRRYETWIRKIRSCAFGP